MKRLYIALLAGLVLLSFAGCGKKAPSADGPFEGKELSAILDAVYANADAEIPALVTTTITADNEQAFLGTTGLSFQEAIASEPAISAIAYSVCLVRLNAGEDMEAAKKAIKENVDPAKWICVRVDPQNVIVDSAGDVIILIMSNEYANALSDSFTQLKTA